MAVIITSHHLFTLHTLTVIETSRSNMIISLAYDS